MRIIRGRLKGLRLLAPKNLPIRPTLDKAKEALFNILYNRFDLKNITALDLFSGSGNISFELASGNCQHITAVDIHPLCIKYIKKIAQEYQMSGLLSVQADVFKYLDKTEGRYDFIFADPPYDISDLKRILELVFEKNVLNSRGILVMEHSFFIDLSEHPCFKEKRKYGQSAFSFFELSE